MEMNIPPFSDDELKALINAYERGLKGGSLSDLFCEHPDFSTISGSLDELWQDERWQDLRAEGGDCYQRALDLLIYIVQRCRTANSFSANQFFKAFDLYEHERAIEEMNGKFEADEQRRAAWKLEERAAEQAGRRDQAAMDAFEELMGPTQGDHREETGWEV